MDAPAQTVGYMIAGYAVIFTALALYILSLYLRWNRLKAEAAVLDELEKQK